MFDIISQYDTQCLLAVNGLHRPWLDTIMWFVSDRLTWIPLYLIMVGWVIARAGKRWLPAILIIALLALTVGATDYLTHALKEWIARPRPTHTALLARLHTLHGYLGGRYGMPSCHAADTMALAMLFSLYTRNSLWIVVLTLFVVLNCWSRMYLGVHYPADILVGLTIGGLLSYIVFRLTPRSVRL